MSPIWSAAVDPCVIGTRACPAGQDDAKVFDAFGPTVRVLRGPSHEHLLIQRAGTSLRFDIIEGTVLAGPVSLHFIVPDDHCLETRITTIRTICSINRPGRQHLQLARRVHALHAKDARDAGASLREIADRVLGPGDWPGDGEHRKSLVRRMIATGEDMVQAGPFVVLAGRDTDRSGNSALCSR
ncbi:MAG: DUF2285 domain-containing protein [Proteobacteria bacterium]|nr:DUF2285 domain-containing protein [Pseudomonadota bacterium]